MSAKGKLAVVVVGGVLLAGCSAQPVGYTVYVPRPGWPYATGFDYWPTPRIGSPLNYGFSRPSVVTPEENAPQTPPSDAGGDRSGSSSSLSKPPETAPLTPSEPERPSLSDRLRDGWRSWFGESGSAPAPPTAGNDDCAGRWWSICHFLP